jgi:hypothetical protein
VILLTKPTFAQDTGVNFLEQEAGISAWMNAGKSIDLAKAKTAFKTIEKDTNETTVSNKCFTNRTLSFLFLLV